MKIRFGINEKKALTGAELYVRVFQIASLLPLIYIFAYSGYPAVVSSKNILSFPFDIGIMAIPRAESLALALAYRLSSSELTVYFSLLVIAFVFGIVAGKLLRASYNTAKTTRIVIAALIAADLIFRMIPIRINLVFGIPALIIGFVIRLGCLVLVITDLKKAEKTGDGSLSF